MTSKLISYSKFNFKMSKAITNHKTLTSFLMKITYLFSFIQVDQLQWKPYHFLYTIHWSEFIYLYIFVCVSLLGFLTPKGP